MSKRLQVVMDDEEYNEIQDAADARRLTVSAWVRQTLRIARRSKPEARKEEAPRDGRHEASESPSPSYAADETAPNPALIRKVMQRHGLATPAEAIEFALQRSAEPVLAQSDLLSLRGTGWSGDLAALRAHPKGADESTGGSA